MVIIMITTSTHCGNYNYDYYQSYGHCYDCHDYHYDHHATHTHIMGHTHTHWEPTIKCGVVQGGGGDHH
jgi:hypothetical protein